jgi:hypothetical protein
MRAAIVEARTGVDGAAYVPADGDYPADHAVPMRRPTGLQRGREVLHLPHAVGHQETRDENVGVREGKLLGSPDVGLSVARPACVDRPAETEIVRI